MKTEILQRMDSLAERGSFPKWAVYTLCGLAVVAAVVLPPRYALVLLPLAGTALAYELTAMWRRRLSYAAGALAVILLVGTGTAQATGFPVFDLATFTQLGTIWTQNASTLSKIIEEVKLAQQIYQTESQTYQLAQTMAQAIRSKNLMAMQGAVQMGASMVPNRFGETAGWNQALNLGTSIPFAYGRATLPLSPNTSFLAAEKLGSSPHLADLARIGIIDDTSQRAMATTAQINRQQASNQPAIKTWESSVNSTSPALNNYAAQQNLTNLGMVQMYEQGRASLAVNSILAQQLTLQNMNTRDQAVRDLNRWQQLQDYSATEPLFWGSANSALKTSPW